MEHLEGQLLATQAAIRALIMISQNPNSAALAVQRELERLTAIGLGKTVKDNFLEGIAYARRNLLPSGQKPPPS